MSDNYQVGNYLLLTIPSDKKVVGRVVHITTVNNVAYAIVWTEADITYSYSFSELDKLVRLIW